MRAALIVSGKVESFIEVEEFTDDWVAPGPSKIGWLWDGRVFTDPGGLIEEPEVPVPQSVPMLNAHLALISAGKMQALTDLVAALPDASRFEAQAYLNLALTCKRDNKWVVQLGAALGYDSAALDQLFFQAATLNP
jgi:hypothetical protein